MKTRYLFLAIAGTLLFASCRTVTQPFSETATIIGQVSLAMDTAGYLTPAFPYNGVQVSLEGTDFSVTTDDSGLYKFIGVPAGTYNVRFHKAGYGDFRWLGMMVQGGGNAPIFWNQGTTVGFDSYFGYDYPDLCQISDEVTTLQDAPLKDSAVAAMNLVQPTRWLVGTYSGPHALSEIAVFFSHHSNVSSTPGQYEYYETWWNNIGASEWTPFDTVNKTFQIPIDAGYYKGNGFKSGDSVYVATYGAPHWGPYMYGYCDYFDPSLRQGVLTSINQTPSPVIGFKIP
jgi:hypothetical protein